MQKSKREDVLKEYKGRDPQELVQEIRADWKAITERSHELIKKLYFLERSQTYKSIPGYEKQEFRVFLYEYLQIPYNRYRELLYAWIWYPEESEQFGAHIIQQVKEKVGAKNVPKVLTDLKAIFQEKGKLPSRKQVKKITARYVSKKPAVKEVDTKSYWKTKHEGVVKNNEELKEDLFEVRKESSEQARMIEKLRAALAERDEIIKALRAENEALRRELEQYPRIKEFISSFSDIVGGQAAQPS